MKNGIKESPDILAPEDLRDSLTPSAEVELLLIVRTPGEGHRGHVVKDEAFDEHPEEHGRLAVLDQGVEDLAQDRLREKQISRPFFIEERLETFFPGRKIFFSIIEESVEKKVIYERIKDVNPSSVNDVWTVDVWESLVSSHVAVILGEERYFCSLTYA